MTGLVHHSVGHHPWLYERHALHDDNLGSGSLDLRMHSQTHFNAAAAVTGQPDSGPLLVDTIEVSERVARYRAVSCAVWNNAFLPDFQSVDFAYPTDDYNYIDARLFDSMVCRPLGLAPPEMNMGLKPIAGLSVLPRTVGDRFEVLISSGRGRWESRLDEPIDASADMRFVALFDWNHYAESHREFVRVVIEEMPQRTEFSKREALLPFDSVIFAIAPDFREVAERNAVQTRSRH